MSNDKKNNYRENVIKRSEEARVVRRIVLVAILLITFVLAYIGYSAYSYINSSLQPVDPNDKTPIEVEIPLGSDRKSTRLNSSHVAISYAVFCLKKKKHLYHTH